MHPANTANRVYDALWEQEMARPITKTAEETGANVGSVEGTNFHQQMPGESSEQHTIETRPQLSDAVYKYVEHSRQGILDGNFKMKPEAEQQAQAHVNSLFEQGLKSMESRAPLLERGARFATLSEKLRQL